MDLRNSDDLSVGIITICSLVMVASFLNAISLASSFYMKDINYSTLLISKDSILPIHTYIVLTLLFSVTMFITTLLILFRKKFAIYIYFLTVILSLILEVTLGNLNFSSILLSIIFPIFLAIFLKKQKKLFGFVNNSELVDDTTLTKI